LDPRQATGRPSCHAWHWEGKSEVAGVTDPQSGGNVVYLSPGLRFASSSGWSAYVSFGVPIVQHIRLSHPERDYRVISGISWSFGR
jgi:hypothetical protein